MSAASVAAQASSNQSRFDMHKPSPPRVGKMCAQKPSVETPSVKEPSDIEPSAVDEVLINDTMTVTTRVLTATLPDTFTPLQSDTHPNRLPEDKPNAIEHIKAADVIQPEYVRTSNADDAAVDEPATTPGVTVTLAGTFMPPQSDTPTNRLTEDSPTTIAHIDDGRHGDVIQPEYVDRVNDDSWQEEVRVHDAEVDEPRVADGSSVDEPTDTQPPDTRKPTNNQTPVPPMDARLAHPKSCRQESRNSCKETPAPRRARVVEPSPVLFENSSTAPQKRLRAKAAGAAPAMDRSASVNASKESNKPINSRAQGQYAKQVADSIERMLESDLNGVKDEAKFKEHTSRLRGFMEQKDYKPHPRTAGRYNELLRRADAIFPVPPKRESAVAFRPRPPPPADQIAKQLTEAHAALEESKRQSKAAAAMADERVKQERARADKAEAEAAKAYAAVLAATEAANKAAAAVAQKASKEGVCSPVFTHHA